MAERPLLYEIGAKPIQLDEFSFDSLSPSSFTALPFAPFVPYLRGRSILSFGHAAKIAASRRA